MSSLPLEQRNPYKGGPPRAWIRIHLVAPGGVAEEIDVHADTGNPFPLIVGLATLQRLKQKTGPNVPTMRSNYGLLTGGRIRVAIPAIAFDRIVLGYGGDAAVAVARKSHPDFVGLVGLPFLRLMQYGGDADWFWIRPAVAPSPP